MYMYEVELHWGNPREGGVIQYADIHLHCYIPFMETESIECLPLHCFGFHVHELYRYTLFTVYVCTCTALGFLYKAHVYVHVHVCTCRVPCVKYVHVHVRAYILVLDDLLLCPRCSSIIIYIIRLVLVCKRVPFMITLPAPCSIVVLNCGSCGTCTCIIYLWSPTHMWCENTSTWR